jgi:hypothetical protein
MVQIHSPRPYLVEPIIYRLIRRHRPPGRGPGGRGGFKSDRHEQAISRSLRDFRRNCVVYTWNLSNLSNSLFNDSPRDKEAAVHRSCRSAFRTGFAGVCLLRSTRLRHRLTCAVQHRSTSLNGTCPAPALIGPRRLFTWTRGV